MKVDIDAVTGNMNDEQKAWFRERYRHYRKQAEQAEQASVIELRSFPYTGSRPDGPLPDSAKQMVTQFRIQR